MKTHIIRSGNELAIKLPKNVIEELRLVEGTPINLKVVKGTLVVRSARPRYTLDELLVGVTPEEYRDAWTWGPDCERE